MTIQEAIKSGKRYRRKCWLIWHDHEDLNNYSKENILADDWEIEVEIKRKPIDVWLFVENNKVVGRWAFSEKEHCEEDNAGRYGKAAKFREVIE